jgi:hybrid polyketide synthase/nonribosomal peptide synthetase ACE1
LQGLQLTFGLEDFLAHAKSGAGTGATTATILPAIENSFGSYTFTDISSAFFAGIRAEFAPHQSKMVFKALDIERPAADQGFTDHSYDVVIASLVLHATRNLETALENVRKLLRPGGFLVILEVTDNTPLRLGLIFGSMPGWWLGAEDGRKLSPCISIPDWHDLMEKTGFSGTRIMAHHSNHVPIPLSVIVGQAVDERVKLLLEPLDTRLPQLTHASLSIVGQTEASRELAATLHRHYDEINIIPALENVMLANLPVSASVVCMVDLEAESIFEDFGEARLAALQAIFKRSKTVIWAMAGAQADNPHKNIFIGFQRTIALELTHVWMQTLNFERAADINPHLIATKLLQLEACGMWEQRGQVADILWHVEPELAVRDGKVMLPRMRVANASNERYNSARRALTRPMPDGNRLSIKRTELGLHLGVVKPAINRHGGEIQLTHSAVRPVRVAASTLFLSTGLDPTGRRLIVLSDSLQSTPMVPPNWMVSAPEDIRRTLDILVALHTHFTARDILSKTTTGERMVILNPPRQLGDCLAVLAAPSGVKLLLLTTNHEHISHPWVHVHPQTTKRFLRKLLPPNIGIFVDMGGHGQVASDIRACLPPNCQQITYPTSTEDFTETQFVFTPDRTRQISDHLISAWMACETLDLPHLMPPNIPHITLRDISSNCVLPKHSHAILSWEIDDPQAIRVQVQPASKQVGFSTNKTYWLVGLKGSLGLCLCEWMAERGAKHLAITSRNPAVDNSWIQAMASLGCTVRLFDGYGLIHWTGVVAVANVPTETSLIKHRSRGFTNGLSQPCLPLQELRKELWCCRIRSFRNSPSTV